MSCYGHCSRTGCLMSLGKEPWPSGDRKLRSLFCFPSSPRCKTNKNLYHLEFCASWVFHTNVLLPSFLFHPPSGRVVVRRGFVASSSRAWRCITWLPPTTLALPSCHQGNVSILTNMPWHLWPSSPICDPISFSHFISPLLYWDSDCSHYYSIFCDHHHLFLPNQFVMPCVPW